MLRKQTILFIVLMLSLVGLMPASATHEIQTKKYPALKSGTAEDLREYLAVFREIRFRHLERERKKRKRIRMKRKQKQLAQQAPSHRGTVEVSRKEILACIRRGEGSSWTSVSPRGTYRGAYQMNRDFWLAYGGDPELADPPAWETASKAEQSRVAWNGWLARGFQPWPPATRICSHMTWDGS